MDEEWAKRGAVEAPLCRKKPSEYLRSGKLYFAAEGDEKSVPEVVRRLGDDIIFYASDVPHWDHDYPEKRARAGHAGRSEPRDAAEDPLRNTRRMYELAPAPPVT